VTLTTRLKINPYELAINGEIQGSNMELCQIHIRHVTASNATYRLPINNR